jgi:hypothetical protein
VKDIDSWSKEQSYLNWQRAVQMANQWRRMLGMKEVSYPYPGDPTSRQA